MKIKRAKLNFSKLHIEQEFDDALQDLIDFSMSTSSTMDAFMEGSSRIKESTVDRNFETVERLKNKLLKMYKLKKYEYWRLV
jgi:hypothetical protein